MSAAVVAQHAGLDLPLPGVQDVTGAEDSSCAVCGHPEEGHELLLTSTVSYVICHARTDDGECFRVRHSQGIAFGACRRDPA